MRHSYFPARQVSCVATKILDLNVLELSSTVLLYSQNIPRHHDTEQVQQRQQYLGCQPAHSVYLEDKGGAAWKHL